MIITAWAEYCSGPGWTNQIVNVLERDDSGRLTLRALQPEEQMAEIKALFGVSATAADSMTEAVKRSLR